MWPLILATIVVTPNGFAPATIVDAIACSDRALHDYATSTQEPVDTIAQAAVEDCRSQWTAAAEDAAPASLKGTKREDFVADFVNAAFPRYLERARPLAIRWRHGGG